MFVALVVATAASLAPPYLAGRAIDDGIGARRHRRPDGDPGRSSWAPPRVNWAATYAQTYLVSWVGQRALQDLRSRIFTHLQSLSIGFYSRNKAGVLISRLTNDVQALDQLVTDGIVTLFSASLTLIGTAAILLFLDPELALVTFAVFPVLLARQRGLPDRLGRRLPRSRARRSRSSPPTSRRRCPASGSCARSARSRATSGASPSSTTRTARRTCARST